MSEKCFSANQEDYHNSLEEAVDDHVDYCGSEEGQEFTIWEADKKEPDLIKLIPNLTEWVIDGIQDNACSPGVGGEWADQYLEVVSEDQKKILDQRMKLTIFKWLKQFGHEPTWFAAIDPKPIKLKFINSAGDWEVVQ